MQLGDTSQTSAKQKNTELHTSIFQSFDHMAKCSTCSTSWKCTSMPCIFQIYSKVTQIVKCSTCWNQSYTSFLMFTEIIPIRPCGLAVHSLTEGQTITNVRFPILHLTFPNSKINNQTNKAKQRTQKKPARADSNVLKNDI